MGCAQRMAVCLQHGPCGAMALQGLMLAHTVLGPPPMPTTAHLAYWLPATARSSKEARTATLIILGEAG